MENQNRNRQKFIVDLETSIVTTQKAVLLAAASLPWAKQSLPPVVPGKAGRKSCMKTRRCGIGKLQITLNGAVMLPEGQQVNRPLSRDYSPWLKSSILVF